MEEPLSTSLAPSAAPLPALHPMTLGEILDRALAIFRANFGRLLAMMLAFQAPLYALRKVAEGMAGTLSRGQKTALPLEALAQLLLQSGLLFAGMFLVHQFAVAAHASAASPAFLGERVEPGRALRQMAARSPQILGTFLLEIFFISLGTALAMVPGGLVVAWPWGQPTMGTVLLGMGLALLGAVAALLYLALRWALVTEVGMIERRSLFAALKRSAQLMAGRTGPTLLDGSKLRASVLYAVNLVISLAVAVVTFIPTGIAYAAFGVSPLNPEAFDPARVPLWAALPGDLLQVFASAALTPFGLLAMVVFYFDLRIKREGFDLELLAARLGGRR